MPTKSWLGLSLIEVMLPTRSWLVLFVMLVTWLNWRVQLVKMVEATSSGMAKMIRKEKYQAVRTATVTTRGWRNTSQYRHKRPAASKNVAITSKTKVA